MADYEDRCCRPAREEPPPTGTQVQIGQFVWSVAVPGECVSRTGRDMKCTSGCKTIVRIREYIYIPEPSPTPPGFRIVPYPTGAIQNIVIDTCIGSGCP